ncbi:MAG: glycosyl hydrolase family 28-related protein, partial [Bacteroidota bacterium]
MKKITIVLINLLISITLIAQNEYYNIVHFGAKGDGKTNNTKAINDAINAASKAGGGTVFFPAGNYLSYTIRLKSHITIYLDQGAILIA